MQLQVVQFVFARFLKIGLITYWQNILLYVIVGVIFTNISWKECLSFKSWICFKS